MQKKEIILVVDDIDINRMILAEIFEDHYEVLEADDGSTAIEIIDSRDDISAILLDLYMPNVDGVEVLKHMNETNKIEKIPVFVVTGADENDLLVTTYHLGAIDVIQKPYIAEFLRCRVDSVVELYDYRKKLEDDIEKKNAHIEELMQSSLVLAAAIESRDCESGEHVKRICSYTEILMKKASDMYEEYYSSKETIDIIVVSSILHDVGKISIPDHILNKPGRLDPDEYEVIKTHTTKGCDLLRKIPKFMEQDVYKYSYDICRHHHERWDGRGYPDQLKGEEIPIWAQVVSIADVYDALTSPRVYKGPFSHEKAMEMIHNGDCGIFNPKLLLVLQEVDEQFRNTRLQYKEMEGWAE